MIMLFSSACLLAIVAFMSPIVPMMPGTGCHLAVLSFAKAAELQDSCGEGVIGR